MLFFIFLKRHIAAQTKHPQSRVPFKNPPNLFPTQSALVMTQQNGCFVIDIVSEGTVRGRAPESACKTRCRHILLQESMFLVRYTMCTNGMDVQPFDVRHIYHPFIMKGEHDSE